FDEALALPSEQAVQVALRTQQIIAYESGVADTVDPLGGSYCIEALTSEIEKKAQEYVDEIDRMGGALKAIERGFIQREIASSAYKYQRAVDSGEQVVVGVNKFSVDDEPETEVMSIGMEVETRQGIRLKRLKNERDSMKVAGALDGVRSAAGNDSNIMPALIDAVKVYATVGELSDALRDVFGEYREPNIL
ncbi:MAG: methylmalonyl-CoA mutase family protein, partial [Chloroflexota bacterium]